MAPRNLLLAVRGHLANARSAGAEYVQCFGLLKGAIKGLLVLAVPSFAGHQVRLMVPGPAVEVWLRLGTTDIAVFNSIFRREEYGLRIPALPKVIVDAGAYTGLSTVYFALKYPDACIIALEPSPYNFDLLELNTAKLKN